MIKKADYINTAFEIGATLCRTAIWYNDSCNWVDLKFNERTTKFYHSPMPADFYEGTAGIAFFLNNLFLLTNEKIFSTTASGALNNAYKHRDNAQAAFSNSFYQGKAGIAYTMLKAYEITGEKVWRTKALELFSEIEQADVNAMRYDIVCGVAGIIPAFIYGAFVLKKKQLLQIGLKFADALIEKAGVQNQSMSWNYNGEFGQPHTGFAHGSSGMGYVFMILFKHTGQEKYLKSALESFNYDDTFFNRELNAWQRLNEPPLSQSEKDLWHQYPSMWCYGAAGIGLAKLTAWLITKNTEHKIFLVSAASRALAANQFETNYGLCHGHFSNCELLLTAGRFLKNKKWIAEAVAVANKGIENTAALNREWVCGGRGNYQTYGFMNGIAGIGNFYLRLADEKVQSGLFLEELL
ncbi:MAG: hypothetical protein IPJ79_04605 [Bacteroidetes bacterium]|nr:hypothetical protein [Bacteroidota bacterium]